MATDLPWKLIEDITNDFAVERKIGSGGFGVVYKGVHQNGEEVAVKKLHHMPGLDEDQFQNELQILTRLRHPNIVQLVGKSYLEQDRCVEHKGRLVFATMIDRVICLEYLPNGSLEKHLSDESSGLPWHRRYKLIKGICDGLEYLHEQRIFHLDLKPANILLDEDMVPKIADFGLSRLFSGTLQSHTTKKFLGTLGYAPPEFIDMRKITNKFDVFSLGVIIRKILTGPDGYEYSDMSASEDFVGLVQGNWRKILRKAGWKDASYLDAHCNQVKTCIEIALKCVEPDRHRRPSIGDIISMLKETEATIDKLYKQLFVVQPLNLCFPFEPDKLISCPLDLTNNADHHIAFRIQPKTPGTFVGSLKGFVPARSTHTCILTMQKQQKPPPNLDAIHIQSVVLESDGSVDSSFIETQAVHDEMKETKITSFYECASQPTSKPRTEILHLNFSSCLCLDLHPTEPWILDCGAAAHGIQIWNYRTKAKLDLSKLQLTAPHFIVAKFIARKQWFVAVDMDGYINVYCYKTMQRVERFEAHQDDIESLVVHPTEPYVMSASAIDFNVKLWDWEKGWECTRVFEFVDHPIYDVTFNPMDTNTFAVLDDVGIKICSLESPGSNFILDEYEDDCIRCFHYFGDGGQQYLIMGGYDATVKIWDLHTKSLVKTVEGVHLGVVRAVCSHPELPILVTGSCDGTVCLWNSTTQRPERIFNFGLGAVRTVEVCIDGSRSYRVVIGCNNGLAMIEIYQNEPDTNTRRSSEENHLVGSRKRKPIPFKKKKKKTIGARYSGDRRLRS